MKQTKLWTAAIGLAVAGTIASGAQAADMMVSFNVVDDMITQSLTGKPGDPVNGKKVVINRKKGNCLACHVMPIPEQQFHGHTGPSLFGVGARLDDGTLRMRLVDPKVINPDTMMPSFYKTDFHRVLKGFEGKTILSAQEVEDVIAFLETLQ